MKNNINLTNNCQFKTSDLTLATTLSLNFPIISVDKSNPRKALFIFEDSTQLQDLIQAYWCGELQIEPKQFFSQLKIVKTRIYG